MNDDWETFDDDGIPITPDYASAYRNRRAEEPAPRRPYRPGYPTPSYYRRIPDPAPEPVSRGLTQRDVAAYETYQDRQGLREIAHLVHNDEVRVKQIERLMARDWEAYSNSPWPAELSRLNGAAEEAKRKSR